jgi:hypothetical protein
VTYQFHIQPAQATLQLLLLACMQGMHLSSLVPAAVITACPALQQLALQDCKLQGDSATNAALSPSAAAAIAGYTQLAHLSITNPAAHLSITSPTARLRYTAQQISVLAQLPGLSSLELYWPLVPLEKLQHVGHLGSQLTSLVVLTDEMYPYTSQRLPLQQSLARFTAGQVYRSTQATG